MTARGIWVGDILTVHGEQVAKVERLADGTMPPEWRMAPSAGTAAWTWSAAGVAPPTRVYPNAETAQIAARHALFGNPPTGIAALRLLVGLQIAKIQMDEESLIFTATDGTVCPYKVHGDCCSYSYFYDFLGVDRLIGGECGPITEVAEIDLELSRFDATSGEPLDPSVRLDSDVVQVYGYRLTTVHPRFGEVSSVFSFRNDSNGYYGGEIAWIDANPPSNVPVITKDTLL